MLEGQHYRATGQLVSLSEQQLLDCDRGDDGCDGGEEDDALLYIAKNGGMYPAKCSSLRRQITAVVSCVWVCVTKAILCKPESDICKYCNYRC